MKLIYKLAYKLGKLTTYDLNNIEIIRQFKLGRRANGPIDYGDYPDLNN